MHAAAAWVDHGEHREDSDSAGAADDATVAEERTKDLPPVVAASTSFSSMQPQTRENEDTRTPSSCSDEKASSSIEDHCGDDASAEAEKRKNAPKLSPIRDVDVLLDGLLGEESPGPVPSEEGHLQALLESGPSLQGSPSAALVPHLSVPRMRGARNSPHSAGNDLQAAGSSGQKGPLGDLITWLDDADVGDVLERYPLPDAMAQPSPGHGASSNQPYPAYSEAMMYPSTSGLPLTHAQRFPEVQECDPDDDSDDNLEEVPSDKETLPRAPPLAPSSVPLMRPLTPDQNPFIDIEQHRTSGYCHNTIREVEGHNEEEEWVARQRLTGAICRLVRYCDNSITPKDDILNLRSTRRGRIMVTAVREKGIAAKAGVVAGDELVSIDGRKDFVGHPARVVHASLRAPVTLVFLGFVGKLQAEVRVKRPPEPKLGLALGNDVISHENRKEPQPVRLCDAVVFRQGDNPSLLITAGNEQTLRSQYDGSVPEAKPHEPTSKTIMYELQREDARNLLVNAMVTTAAL